MLQSTTRPSGNHINATTHPKLSALLESIKAAPYAEMIVLIRRFNNLVSKKKTTPRVAIPNRYTLSRAEKGLPARVKVDKYADKG